MSVNVSDFAWNAKRETAAALVAQDQLTDIDIAARVGVTERQLNRWKTHPEFAARVAEHVTAQREALKAEGIANRQNRVDALNDRWARMQTIIAERAANHAAGAFETIKDADGNTEWLTWPGWDTGLMVRSEKQIGAGDKATRVIEFAVDTGLLRELRAHEEQAAKELGQWQDKHRIDGEMMIREYVGVDPDAV